MTEPLDVDAMVDRISDMLSKATDAICDGDGDTAILFLQEVLETAQRLPKTGVRSMTAETTQTKFQVGDSVFKWTGDYTGPGIVRGIAFLGNGKARYLVGHQIKGGEGELLHTYAEGNLRVGEPGDP